MICFRQELASIGKQTQLLNVCINSKAVLALSTNKHWQLPQKVSYFIRAAKFINIDLAPNILHGGENSISCSSLFDAYIYFVMDTDENAVVAVTELY